MDQIVVGDIRGAYGVKGWLKVRSHTEPRDNILHYSPWFIEHRGVTREYCVLRGHLQGASVLVQLEGIAVREEAAQLAGAVIRVSRSSLPALPPGEYYWADLIGMAVETVDGVAFGQVVDVFATGANDVLVAQGDKERAIPFLQGSVVKQVDLAERRIVVDWPADF